MPSQSKLEYDSQRKKADLILSHASSLRAASKKDDKAILLHASLAAHVAAWDAYIKAVALRKYSSISRPNDAGYSLLKTISEQGMRAAAKKLNTPNADNTRKFLMEWSQFDPWPHWSNIKFGNENLTSTLLVKERIDEILKVRHSFSHGFPMPAYSWNQDSNQNTHLSTSSIKSVSSFFESLVSRTDTQYSIHISTTFAIERPW